METKATQFRLANGIILEHQINYLGSHRLIEVGPNGKIIADEGIASFFPYRSLARYHHKENVYFCATHYWTDFFPIHMPFTVAPCEVALVTQDGEIIKSAKEEEAKEEEDVAAAIASLNDSFDKDQSSEDQYKRALYWYAILTNSISPVEYKPASGETSPMGDKHIGLAHILYVQLIDEKKSVMEIIKEMNAHIAWKAANKKLTQ